MARSHTLLGATEKPAVISIRRIGLTDLKTALAKGFDDFYAMPTHAIFLCLIYPVVGIVLARLVFGYSILPLLYPLATGFTLIGPIAALGLYEISRRRETGAKVSATNVLDVVQSSSISSIIALAVLLVIVFVAWIAAANAIYVANFGYASPHSMLQFIREVLTTRPGWNLIIIGNLVGLLFATLTLTISSISFPLLLDRDVGAAAAVLTSIRLVVRNPGTMTAWGLVVATLLLIGSLPVFLGLAVTVPILGHATWHLYRAAVVVDPKSSERPTIYKQTKARRYAADFPSVLFPWTK